jgi:hypothetical protein
MPIFVRLVKDNHKTKGFDQMAMTYHDGTKKRVSRAWEKINKTEKRLVSVELTDEELIEKGSLQASAIQQIQEIEEQISEFGSRGRAKIKTLMSESRDLAQMIVSKEELREMDCDIYFDPRAQRAFYAIDDAVVGSRAMTSDEFQRLLDFETAQGERAGNLVNDPAGGLIPGDEENSEYRDPTDFAGMAFDAAADEINNGTTPEGKKLKGMGSIETKRPLKTPDVLAETWTAKTLLMPDGDE